MSDGRHDARVPLMIDDATSRSQDNYKICSCELESCPRVSLRTQLINIDMVDLQTSLKHHYLVD